MSKTTLNSTLHDLVESAITDLHKLKDNTKKSEFVYEEKDVDRVTNELVKKVKSLYSPNGKI